MREKGQLVKRGALDGKGDIEFWDDEFRTEEQADNARIIPVHAK